MSRSVLKEHKYLHHLVTYSHIFVINVFHICVTVVTDEAEEQQRHFLSWKIPFLLR